MSWLISISAPWLWPVAAVAALGLWVWSLVVARQPGGTIAAEIIRLGAVGCACAAAALAVWAAADEACQARVAAATSAETERQRIIVGDALTAARAEGAAAMADAARARAELEAAIDAAEHAEMAPAGALPSVACGLSRRWTEALPQ